MKRTTLFKPASSGPGLAKGRQSIRGRISAPIPMSEPAAQSAENESPGPTPSPDVRHGEVDVAEDDLAENDLPAAISQPPASTAGLEAAGDTIITGAVPEEEEEEEGDAGAASETADEPASGPEPGAAAELVIEPSGPVGLASSPEPSEPMPPLQSQKVRQAAEALGVHGGAPAEEQHLEVPPAEPSPQPQQHQRHQQALQAPSLSAARARPTPGTASPNAVHTTVSPALRHRTNPSSTLRYSEASGASTGAGTATATATVTTTGTSPENTLSGSPNPQRKKSTLRGALSKLFGRRKKVNSQILAPVASQAPENVPQHRSVRSDPTVLSRPRDSEPKRSASLPLTEYDRALRSHSIGPHDLAAIESARTSFQTEGAAGSHDSVTGAGGRRRGAAASSSSRGAFASQTSRRHFSNKSAEVLGGSEWTGLSPRPASAHGRGTSNRGAFGSGVLGRDSDGRGSGNGVLMGSGVYGSGAGSGAGHHGAPAADPDEIGRAITSDAEGGNTTEISSRRRSRSLSGLNEMALDQAQSRRRSDEIRFWRESYDPAFLSPLSSGPEIDMDDAASEDENDRRHGGSVRGDEDEDGCDEDDNEHGDNEHGSTLRSPDAAAYHAADDDAAGVASLLQGAPVSPMGQIGQGQHGEKGQQGGPQARSRTPPEPFAFGNLSNLGTVAGSMKITQANSLDARLGGLETRMHHMEHVVDQLCHAVPGFKDDPSTPPPPIPRSFPSPSSGQPAIPPIPAMYQSQAAPVPASSTSRHSAYSGHSLDSDTHSHLSFGEGQTYIGSLHPPSTAATQTQSIAAPTLATAGGGGLRPASTSTVRGATSLPALGSAAGDSTADLMAQLESERAVRQTLETQVKKLNERVNALSTTMYAMLRDPAAKPRRSREPLLAAQPSSSSLREPSAAASASAAATQLKVESVIQTAKALGHGLPADTETESEGFLTPGEIEEPHGHYDFSDDSHAVAAAGGRNNAEAETRRQKKAARTLSLGQLTLGKNAVST